MDAKKKAKLRQQIKALVEDSIAPLVNECITQRLTQYAEVLHEQMATAPAGDEGRDALIAERDELRKALGEAWAALYAGGDCASMLADLQESGVYRPRCSDGKPSNADARRDYQQIAATAKRIHPLAFGTPTAAPHAALAADGEKSK